MSRTDAIEWGAVVCLIVGIGAALYYVVKWEEARSAAKEASIQAQVTEDAELQMRLRMDEEKRIAAKNEAWTRCMSAGDRPVMGGLTTVVCIKREAVSWEFRIP